MRESILGWLRFVMVVAALLVGAGERREAAAQPPPTGICYQIGCEFGTRVCGYTGSVWCYHVG